MLRAKSSISNFLFGKGPSEEQSSSRSDDLPLEATAKSDSQQQPMMTSMHWNPWSISMHATTSSSNMIGTVHSSKFQSSTSSSQKSESSIRHDEIDEASSISSSADFELDELERLSPLPSNRSLSKHTQLDELNNQFDSEEHESNGFSFYQGFKATQQYLPTLLKHGIVSSQMKGEGSDAVVKSSSHLGGIGEPSHHSSTRQKAEFLADPVLKKAASHYMASIKNISLLFSDLLSERTSLLEQQRVVHETQTRVEHELTKVTETLSQLSRKKESLEYKLNETRLRRNNVDALVQELESRLNAVVDQTMYVEDTVRRIKGDSVSVLNRSLIEASSDTPNTPSKSSLLGHDDSVEALYCEHPYGTLVSGSADKTVRVWDLSRSQPIAVLSGHTGWVKAVYIQGYTVLSGSSDHTIRQWDISRGTDLNAQDNSLSGETLIRVYKGHTGGITSLKVDKLAHTMYSGSLDKTIKIWDLETGNCVSSLISSAPLSSVVAVESHQRALKRESNNDNLETLAPVFTSPEFQGWGDTLEGPSSFRWKEETRTSYTNTLSQWDIRRPEPISDSSISNPTVSHAFGGVHSLCLSNQTLMSGHSDGLVQLWDTRTKAPSLKFVEHVSSVTALHLDDIHLYSGGHDKSFKIWDIRAGAVIQDIPLPGIVTNFWSDTRTIRIAAGSTGIFTYEKGADDVLPSPDLGHVKFVRSVCHFGSIVMTGSLDKTIRISNI